MYDDPRDVSCAQCGAGVHPFLAECPVCGTARTSQLEAARATPDLGATRLADDAHLLQSARLTVNLYRLRQGGSPDDMRLDDGFRALAEIVTYTASTSGGEVAQATLSLDGDDLVIREARQRSQVERIPLALIRASDGRKGTLTVHGPGGVVAIRNRSGFTVSKARADHYRTLASWLAILAAGAAERRWTEIGVERHAAELGLVPARPDTPAAPAEVAGPGTATGPRASDESRASSVREALRELEALRADGLVSEAEYAGKRRDILDRL